MGWTGIDPGKKGAIVTIHDDGSITKRVMPLDRAGNMDLDALCGLLSSLKGNSVYLEEIHSIYGTGKGSMFTMGRGLGNIEAALVCNGIDFQYIKPYSWQKTVWVYADHVYKKPSGKTKRKVRDTKATSLKCVKRLYPTEDFRYGDLEPARSAGRRTKNHDGLVDAMLIAHSCKQNETV